VRRRGHLYYAHLPTGDGASIRKIVLVVSWDSVNRGMQPIVVRVTSKWRERNIPTYVPLEAGEGNLPKRSYVLCHELLMLPEEVIDDNPIGRLPIARMLEVAEALKRTLALT